MLKNQILYPAIATVLVLFTTCIAHAQFPYFESFKNATAPGLVVSGAAKLTAAAGIDAAGSGYLRLTENTTNSVGYVYAQDSFPSVYGLTASFEFFTWKTGATNSNQADGISFFLFDASVNAFRPGGVGGSLGYANYYGTPGMAKGYIGIGIDEFGNFSLASDGSKNGGAGTKQPGSIVIRGPGNSAINSLGATDYVYKTGITTSSAPYNIAFSGSGFSQRFPDPTSPNYRKLKIILTPGSSLGATGYTITVIMYKGGASLTAVPLINNFDYPYKAPEKLQFGLASSTGGVTTYHEIRNMDINVTNTGVLIAPTLVSDAVTVACQGQQAMLDVTANDVCNNSGGLLNKATVDLNPATPGRQTSFTDAGKGTYAVDALGIVSFTPVSGFSGLSSISYAASDTYGKAATTTATISVTINATTGPSLTITNPPSLCSPLKADITSPSYKINTTPGATYSYFTNLSDANNNLNDINATANSIAQSGTYYIRALYNSCPTVKPIVVQIDAAPTTATISGGNQSYCNFTGSQSATLLGNNPDIGTGAWTQVSGPATATISYPDAATSPLLIVEKGVYVYRWSITNGACAASTSAIQISVGRVPSNAGTAQVLCNGTSTTLQGNIPSPGTGLWSKVSGPAITITAPSSPTSTVTGLTPGNNYTLAWTTTNGSCTSTSQVSITSNAAPIADAGSNQTISNATTTNLNATAPATGSGIWTQISGPTVTISTPANAGSALTGLTAGDVYGFRWTVTDGTCVSTSDVTVTDVLNTIANAGPDQALGSVSQFTLNGNTPDASNTGAWTIVSSPLGSTAVIAQPTQPVTAVDAVNRTGDYIFRWTISNSSFSNSDDIKVNVSSVLAARFLSFRGVPKSGNMMLTWQTAGESNNDHFDIERSLDGRTFSKIGTVDAARNAATTYTYMYNDPVTSLTSSVVYYRLQQVDQDGHASYSNIIKLNVPKTDLVSLWPNPFQTRINVKAYFNSGGTARISVYDNSGRQLRRLYRQVTQGNTVIAVELLQPPQVRMLLVEISKDGFTYRKNVLQE